MVARLVVGLLVVGVDDLAERHLLLLVVAFERSMGVNLSGRLSFGSFGLFRSVRLGKGALRRVGQCPGWSGLLLIVSADLLPEVVVQLLEADMLVGEELGVDAVEVGRVLSAEVFNIFSGEIDAGGGLAFVLPLGRLDEGRGVLLDR